MGYSCFNCYRHKKWDIVVLAVIGIRNGIYVIVC